MSVFQGVCISRCPYFKVSVRISRCLYFKVSVFQGVCISRCLYFKVSVFQGVCPYFKVSVFQGVRISGWTDKRSVLISATTGQLWFDAQKTLDPKPTVQGPVTIFPCRRAYSDTYLTEQRTKLFCKLTRLDLFWHRALELIIIESSLRQGLSSPHYCVQLIELCKTISWAVQVE